MKYNFTDRVVVVTGAASGIGAAIASHFSQEGSKIGMLDVDEAALKEREEELRTAGAEVLGMRCDITDYEDCERAMQKIIQHFGGIDVLVNNAGITHRSAFINTENAVYRKVMDVNFFGSIHCTKAAIASIIKRKGMIITISSIAGLAPTLGRTGYCASKHALHGFFSTLRTELLDTGVHVMIVCPCFVLTNIQKRALDGDGTITTHPQSRVGKLGTPESVAQALYRGARRKKNLLVLSPIGKLTHLLYRFVPKRYEHLMARQLRDELIR